MKYAILSVTHFHENLQSDLLTNYTWKYKEWSNSKFGLMIREVTNPHYPSSTHCIAFKRIDGFYREISMVEWNIEVDKTKTKVAGIL